MSISEGITAGISTTVAQLVERTFKGLADNSKEAANQVAAKLVLGFERYVATTRSQCDNVKTLISPGQPIRLSSAYEPVDLQIGGATFTIDQLVIRLNSGFPRALITATLGSGKSFTMRYLYSQLSMPGILNQIPIFVELGYIPFHEKTLISYIHELLSPFTNFVSEKSILAGLKSGVFCLLLDGYDEISINLQSIAERQINKIASEYPDNVIVVSSRPEDSRFVGWHNFPEYSVLPLKIEKAESLIRRIEFDEGDKSAFIRRLRSGLYNSHQQIASNPLLVSMMLLTFKEFQEIPSKMHIFYGTAFDVLYRRHDTIKTDYQREFASGLDLVDFKRFFMTFCFITFLDRKVTFDGGSFATYTRRALDYEEIEAVPTAVGADLNKNVCIMLAEGDKINFMHRSFQEYFAALFLSKRSIDESSNYIDHLVSEASAADFAKMLTEIDREEFERKYFLDKIRKLDEEFSEAGTNINKARLLSDVVIVMVFEAESKMNAMIFPVGFRMKGMQDKVRNTMQLIQAIGSFYDIDICNSPEHTKVDWEKHIPSSWSLKDGLGIIPMSQVSVKMLKVSGLAAYATYLHKRLRTVRRDMEDRHARKTKLLSEFLRKAPSKTHF